jgi:xanthine dehydrogenase accessory factor
MLVTARETIGTIGGGQLEYQCTRIACEQLKAGSTDVANKLVRRFALGANCGQCCGGVVEVMFEHVFPGTAWLHPLENFHIERVAVAMVTSIKEPASKYLITADTCMPFADDTYCPDDILISARAMLSGCYEAKTTGDYLLEPIRPNTFNIAVFGAGHVGAATVDVLSRLECNIRWIDSRRDIFPTSLPDNVLAVESADPAREVLAMPPGSWFLIMTHSHPADQEICARVLGREDFAYCGLIGSVSKRRRFERLMRKQGIPDVLLDRLVCPVGVTGITGRKPVEIAIAVGAEVLQVRDALLGKTSAPVEEIRAI